MFLFFLGKKTLPKDYTIEYICDLLNITYTELEKQPSDWVYKMIDIKIAKQKTEDYLYKKAEKKLKSQRKSGIIKKYG